MIKQIPLVISFCLFLLSSNLAQADTMRDAELQNVLANLITWLEDRNYIKNRNIDGPDIKIINTKKICTIVFGNNEKIKNQKQCANIMGLYDFYNQTIYINHNVDLYSIEGQAIILHELVHYFQYASGKATRVANIKQLETLAYYLENKFIKEHSLLASTRH